METERRRADVVLDDARPPEASLELGAERQVRPAEVDGERDGAGERVHATGDADTDRGDVVDRGAGGGERGVDDRAISSTARSGRAGRGRRDLAGQDALVAIDDEHGDLAAADVDTDEQRAVAAVGCRADVVGHRCTVRPSSRVSSSAQAPRRVRSSPTPPSTIRVSRASGPSDRRVASSRIASSHGSPRAVTVPWTTISRTSRMPIRLATAAPRARPAARVTARAVSSPVRGRGGQFGERLRRRPAARGGPQDRRGAGDGLEAAEPSAVALRPVGLDDDVADLAGAVAVAPEQLAVEDEAGADATPDLDRDEVRGPVVALEQERCEGGRAAVVGDDRRKP